MRNFLLGLALSIAFIAGCLARPHVVPPAQAHSDAAGPKWEYNCVLQWADKSFEAVANNVGEEGWELAAVGVESGSQRGRPLWCFKRRR